MTQVKWNVEHLAQVDSTNTWLVQRARAGAGEGEVVYADFQSAGRGRLEREWVSPAGSSLLCSVLFETTATSAAAQVFVLAAALSLVEALQVLTGARPSIKWPNDVMFGESKVAGLLGEVHDHKIVVGLGLNLSDVDPEFVGATTVLAATGVKVTAQQVLEGYLGALARRRGLLDSLEGTKVVVAEFTSSLSTLGRYVRAELAGEVVRGRAIGVEESGALRLETAAGEHVVTAGDVVHLRGEEQS